MDAMARPITYCSVKGCATRCAANGMCDMHYRRWKKHGDPLVISDYKTPAIPVESRFWSKVDKTGPVPPERPDLGRCWLWTASTIKSGYGVVRADGRSRRAHVVAYELLVGPVPAGMELDHLCGVKPCVRPSHLEPVTHGENVRRGLSGSNMAAKTHCPKDHPYDEANTYRYKGRRYCRRCLADKKNRARWRRQGRG